MPNVDIKITNKDANREQKAKLIKEVTMLLSLESVAGRVNVCA
jgi:phenylpyruvate tautomerase PptA (4-oxalocrotonate tautomerase family)